MKDALLHTEGELGRALAFIVEIDRMKDIARRTSIYSGTHRENDAEHSWHLAMMAIAFEKYAVRPINMLRVLKMTLVHDLVEIYAGDTFAYDKEANRDKAAREAAAADRVFTMIPEGADLRALWEEFDEAKTADAVFAAALDRLQPLIANYLNDGQTWIEGNVEKTAVYNRIAPLKEAIPALWDTADAMIREGISRGYIRE